MRTERDTIIRSQAAGPSNRDEDQAPDYTPEAKKSRAKRPGQPPPMARVDEGDEGDEGVCSADFDRPMHFDYDEEAEIGDKRKKEENQYKERVTREHERWQDQRAEATSKAVLDLPFVRASKHLQCTQYIAQLQENINDSWKLHKCCSERGADGAVNSFDMSCLSSVPQGKNEKRSTIYYGPHYSGTMCSLVLPVWICSKCHETVKPHPLTFGCWPSSPLIPTFWIDVDVLEQYRMLGPAPKAGTSARVFVASVERVV